MKLLKTNWTAQRSWSLPVRGRGLKHLLILHFRGFALVAPRAGAWIETLSGQFARYMCDVAPRAGAWIETGI